MSEKSCIRREAARKKVARGETSGTRPIDFRAGGAAELLCALSGRGRLALRDQTFHVWLPSRYAFGVKTTFQTRA